MFTIPTGSFASLIIEQIISTLYKDAIVADSPILYYRLNEASGSNLTSLTNEAQNTASYNNDITLNQSSAVNDSNDKSIFINGLISYSSNIFSYIKLLTNPTINSDFSIELWFKTDKLHPGTGAIVYNDSDCYLGIGNGTLFTYDFNSAKATYLNQDVLYNDNQWHHVVITKTNAVINGTVFYIDGREIERTTITRTGNLAFYFGIQPSGLSPGFVQPYEGNIDEIAIYNSLLSKERIEAHYLSSGRNLSPLTSDFYPANRINTPSILPGLYLWVNSSNLIKDNTSKVERLQDLSGRYRDLTQSTESRRPIIVLNTLGNKPVVRFNNTNTQGFQFPSSSSIRTVYWVLRREPTNTGLFLLGASEDASINSYGFHGGSSAWFDSLYAHPNILNSLIFRINGTSTSPTSNYKITSNEYLIIALVTNGNVSANSFSFDRNNLYSNASLYGDLVELVIYEQAHTLTQVQQMETYFRNYGTFNE